MTDTEPKWRRRKEARPQEIAEAALAVFAERGFAAAKLEEIAKRAGVSKAALYLYFDTKEALFAEVVRTAVAPGVARVRGMIEASELPFDQFLQLFAGALTANALTGPAGGIAKMVIGESRNFPQLARLWVDEIVGPMLSALTGVVAKAQAKGEVRSGDPRVYAVQIVAPFLVSVLWRETFVPVGEEPFDLQALAAQHLATLRGGLMERAS
ncbi:MAG: TetR family transcriptional regulator [Caulobacterales bacterium 68-7]|nr:TetR/AcrR family transcriptional regulator [Caulobacterales bacterium]OJU07590.1 MAG: TetR family transcriptional regulator [Caulobacterales bacterium 68-7]